MLTCFLVTGTRGGRTPVRGAAVTIQTATDTCRPTMSGTLHTPPGWYPDAESPGALRYWDGAGWTAHRSGNAPVKGGRSGRRTAVLVVVLTLGAFFAVVAWHAMYPPAGRDVTVTRCGVDSLGVPFASGEIKNNTMATQTYGITVGFFDSAGTRVADGLDIERDVGVNQRASWKVSGSNDGPVATCRVLKVDRY